MRTLFLAYSLNLGKQIKIIPFAKEIPINSILLLTTVPSFVEKKKRVRLLTESGDVYYASPHLKSFVEDKLKSERFVEINGSCYVNALKVEGYNVQDGFTMVEIPKLTQFKNRLDERLLWMNKQKKKTAKKRIDDIRKKYA